MKRLGFLMAVFAVSMAPAFAQGKLSTLLTNGPTAKLLNIVILAEGFTAGQESSFTNQAAVVLEKYLSTPPYKSYRTYFNAFAVFVPSAEQGSDHPSQNSYRDTYFNSTYGSYGIERLLTIPPNDIDSDYSHGRGKVDSLLQRWVPEYDIVLLLVNDTEYGGSGGVPAVTSLNSSSSEIAIHEVGHSFAALGDEYTDPYPGYPETEEPNTTKQTIRAAIKWNKWIASSTPLPTPETSAYASTVGLFEGAHYHESGWYRPKLDCKMQSLGTPFCEVCGEAIILSAYSRVDMILSQSPAGSTVTLDPAQATELSVKTLQPADHDLAYTWVIDGVTNTTATTASFAASTDSLSPGKHTVRVVIKDPTRAVRNDPQSHLVETRTWTVTVPATGNQPPEIGDVPDQTILAGTPLEVTVTVSDSETAADDLLVTGRSSNTNVVPNGDILVSGSGAERTVTITSAPCLPGQTTITLNVTDGATSAETSFLLTTTVNFLPPVLAPIADQTAMANTSLTLALSISDPGNCSQNIGFTARSGNPELISDAGIVLAGTVTNATAVLTPNPNQTGMAAITIGVTSGLAVSQQTFNLTVLAPIVAGIPSIKGDSLELNFETSGTAALVLEKSLDLVTWTPVLTNSANSIHYSTPLNGSAEFFRAAVKLK